MEAVPREDGARSKYYHCVALVLIVVAAALLRLWGIRWGLPNELHDYSYHPDEFLTVGSAFGAIYLQRSLNPRFYNYPSLYIYLSALAIAVALGWGLEPKLSGIYLSARIVTALIGTAAVLVIWWACGKLCGNTVGLLAALVMCVAPIHVQHSHFATVDVPSTLFVAASLGYAGLVLRRGSWRDYVLAGAMCGLAAGTKYNAALVLLSVIAAHFAREGARWPALRSARIWAAIGCMAAAFVISTPGSVVWTGEFVRGVAYEMKHASTGHGLVFAGTGNGFAYTFMHSLWYGLSPGLSVLFVIAAIAAVWRRDKAMLAVLAFAVPYYVLISLSQVRFARYTLPLMPAAAILIGWLIVSVYRALAEHKARILTVGRSLWVIFACACVFFALFYSLVLDVLFIAPDPRDDAARWFKRHAARGDSIGMIDWPWFYSPPLSKGFGFGTLADRQNATEETPYQIVVFRSQPEGTRSLGKLAPKWVIVSDYEVADAVWLRSVTTLSAADRAEVKRILREFEWINRHYRHRATFSRKVADLDSGSLPHDMRYSDPVITIYERKR